MISERLEAARKENTLILAELILLTDTGTPEVKEVTGRIIARVRRADQEIDHADALARGAAGMARRLGAETAKLLAPPASVDGEQAAPTAKKNGPCRSEVDLQLLGDLTQVVFSRPPGGSHGITSRRGCLPNARGSFPAPSGRGWCVRPGPAKWVSPAGT